VSYRVGMKEMQHAMGVMGLTAQQQKSVFKVLAAILTLGNLEFAQNDKDEAYITNADELGWVAYLLEVEEQEAQNSIVLRTIESGSQRASVFKCPQNVEGALYSRDALAKELYSRLFDFIVHTVNAAMHKEMGTSVTVGILDIYGFEIFDVNMFEQLCVSVLLLGSFCFAADMAPCRLVSCACLVVSFTHSSVCNKILSTRSCSRFSFS
jgi:myosin I